MAAAQRVTPTFDIGAVGMRYADSITARGAALTPAVTIAWPRALLAAWGTWSQFEGSWSTQGSASASLFTRALGPLTGELEIGGGASAHQDGSRTGQGSVIGRAHLTTQGRGLWAGGGGGMTGDGETRRSVRQLEAGGWVNLRDGSVSLAATPTAMGDSVRFTDLQGALHLRRSRVILAFSAGTRIGDRLPSIDESSTVWGGARAEVAMAPAAAIVASVGSYPVDYAQGYPGGRYATLGLRFGGGSAAPVGATEPTPETQRTAPVDGVTAFAVRSAGADRWTLRISAAGAREVEIAGDFSDWAPVRLVRESGGWWTTTIRMPAGRYEMNVRVNGGRWIVPPGLEASKDEFGGVVGILILGR